MLISLLPKMSVRSRAFTDISPSLARDKVMASFRRETHHLLPTVSEKVLKEFQRRAVEPSTERPTTKRKTMY
jgi:hypothetical protein